MTSVCSYSCHLTSRLKLRRTEIWTGLCHSQSRQKRQSQERSRKRKHEAKMDSWWAGFNSLSVHLFFPSVLLSANRKTGIWISDCLTGRARDKLTMASFSDQDSKWPSLSAASFSVQTIQSNWSICYFITDLLAQLTMVSNLFFLSSFVHSIHLFSTLFRVIRWSDIFLKKPR